MIALLLRVGLILDIQNSIYNTFIFWDELPYHLFAKQILQGTFNPGSAYSVSPAYLYLHVFLYKILSPNIDWLRYSSLIFGLGTCGLIYLIAKEVFDRSTAMLATIFAAIYQPFVLYSAVAIKTGFNTFLLAIFVLCVLRARQKSVCSLFSGLALAALIPGRQQCLIYILIPFAYLLETKTLSEFREKVLPKILWFYLGVALVFIPIAIRNYTVAGFLRVTPNTSGFSLYSAYSPENPTPYFRLTTFASGGPEMLPFKTTAEARRRTGLKLSPSEASDYWLRESWRAIFVMPWQKLLNKTLAPINAFEDGDNYDLNYLPYVWPTLRYSFLSSLFLIPLGLAGLFFFFNLTPASRLLCLISLFYLLGLVLTVSESRFRVPWMITIIPLAAAVSIEFLKKLIDKSYCYCRWLVVISFSFLSLAILPLPGTDASTIGPATQAALLMRNKHVPDAVKLYEETAKLPDVSADYSFIFLGQHYLARKDFQKAKLFFQSVRDGSMASQQKYNGLASLAKIRKNLPLAMQYYRKSLEYDSAQLYNLKQLADYYKTRDPVQSNAYEQSYQEIKALSDQVIPRV